MAKTATETTTKTATKRANAKTSRAKADKSDKPKRAPTAYNLFVQSHMKPWLEAHQGKTVKDAMVEIGALWREAPENPNRGKDPKAKKAKEPKAKEPKSSPKPKPSKKKAPEPASSDVENSDDDSEE
ncbi:hypothetical protein SERLA73DRAFT_181183 [Serpula lacrymans var. lacrymans S7.3]|uniref:HMG box domain-containing protein n=2 Tax=Serpula lacrymans var. lacrymans TaxID=341189 RepID=F8PXL5_SERL3|nr:uncharacterized protein SERLADRAFT_467120 [Serpula lacrymans var. lacrymans S7.9]EGN98628.1 hypothetical protein SERLA73DRAFT_181183 [Serpula lacrymans var. lacrymans S7.3]EGO24194.1 hypothetical protein SERLADRAFT_467120 [Serpula lacrymans var. lacrymans S7.9]